MAEPNAAPSTEFVVVSDPCPGVRILRLNRPTKRNALNAALLGRLAAEVRRADTVGDVRALILAGDNKSFSAGADIATMAERGAAAYTDHDRLAAWATIENCPLPLIAAVEGQAFGGGFELALLADFIMAGESARFALPEVSIGAIPGDGGTQRVTQLAGRVVAMRLILTGEPISAHQAAAWGLVTDVVAEGTALDSAISLAEMITRRAPNAVRAAKDCIRFAETASLSAGLAYERHIAERALASEEAREGMRAFMEKRPPRFPTQPSSRLDNGV